MNAAQHLAPELIQDLVTNGLNTRLYNFTFKQTSPNTCVVDITNVEDNSTYKANFGIEKEEDGIIYATLIGYFILFKLSAGETASPVDTIQSAPDQFKEIIIKQLERVIPMPKGADDTLTIE